MACIPPAMIVALGEYARSDAKQMEAGATQRAALQAPMGAQRPPLRPNHRSMQATLLASSGTSERLHLGRRAGVSDAAPQDAPTAITVVCCTVHMLSVRSGLLSVSFPLAAGGTSPETRERHQRPDGPSGNAGGAANLSCGRCGRRGCSCWSWAGC